MFFSCNNFLIHECWFRKSKNVINVSPEEGERVETNVIFVVYVFERILIKLQSWGQIFLQGFMCRSYFQSIASFLMWSVFLVYLTHLVFFHIWNVVYNSLEFILAMLYLLFQTFIKVSSKVTWNSSCWCSMWCIVLSYLLNSH